MATYIDRSRLSEVTCSIASNLRVHVYPSDVPTPDTLDQYGPIEGSLTFGSNQQTATLFIYGWGSTSSFGTSSWTWQVRAAITCNNGFGATNTQTLVLASGTGTAANAPIGISVNIGATNIAWTGTVNQATVYWDISTPSLSSTAGSDIPDVTYNCYDRSNIGGTATAKLEINGQNVIATGAISTATAMTWDLRLGLNMWNNTTTMQPLVVSPGVCNGISLVSSIPSYVHVWKGQSATATQYNVQGQGNTLPASFITGSTNFTLRRLVRLKGRIRAFRQQYPDDLNCKITGFDNLTLGYRNVTAYGGEFQEDDAFLKSSVNTSIQDYNPIDGITTNSYSQTQNTVPATISADIYASSLTSYNDDSTNTKLMLRGWHFNGSSVIQSNFTTISSGLLGNNRTFASPGVGLNSYRYLQIECRTLTGTSQSGTLAITTQPNSTVKSWSINTSSSAFEWKTIDLCSPNNAVSILDETDHPYPRFDATDQANITQSVDGDYFGITRATLINLSNANIETRDIRLALVPSDGSDPPKGYWMPAKGWYKQKKTVSSGNIPYINRLFQCDTQGNSQTEEGSLFWQGTSGTILKISDFVNNMNALEGSVKIHQGFTATNPTAFSNAGYIRNDYLCGVNGWAHWLGGTTFRKMGGSAEVKNWVEIDHSSTSSESMVPAQTYFRSINGDFPPDILDIFEQDDAGAVWLSIGCVSYQRGRSFGLLLNSDGTGANLQTANLVLDSTGENRGVGTSDTYGRYYTAAPYGLGTKNHNTLAFSQNSGDPDPLFTNKQYRFVFKNNVSTGSGPSADKSPVNENYYSTVESGTVHLWYAEGPLGTNWIDKTTPITSASRCYIRFIHSDRDLGIIFFVRHTDGSLKRYYSIDFGDTVSVATTISSVGNNPAMCVDRLGKEYYFYKNGSNIERVILDAAGNILQSAGVVITGNVVDTSIGCYERLDDIFIVYQHSSLGIVVVRSTDGGITFS